MLFGKCVIKSDSLLMLKRNIILCLLKLRHNFFMHKMEALMLVLLSIFYTKEQSLLKNFSHLSK